ncbi:MAG: manganese transporter [Bacteroidetes bacterium]|nr:MAG: manganese transporter [Bacteroidota bacterium]TAG86339.1 MAG: manganese transporter [Bacteroidota bacterium]
MNLFFSKFFFANNGRLCPTGNGSCLWDTDNGGRLWGKGNGIFFCSFFILFFFASCENQDKENEKNTNYIVCTTGMIADAVKNIIGKEKDFTIITLMGAGIDPHLYKATPKDLQYLRKSAIVFYNGLHLEGKMAEVLENFSKQKTIVSLGDKLDKKKLRSIGNNQYDPHIWFDVSLWAESMQAIPEILIKKFPHKKEIFEENTAKYIEKLQKLHQEVKKSIQTIPKKQRVLITAHDAFGYFGKAYQIEVKGLQGISTLSDFGLKDITDLVNFIIKNKIKAIFVESSIPKKSLEAVIEGCQQKNHTIKIGGTLYSDALGAENTKEGSYIGMVEENVKIIVENLL